MKLLVSIITTDTIGYSFGLLIKADQTAKKFIVLFTFGMPIINTISVASIAIMSFIYCYMKNRLHDGTCLYRPLRFSSPWDQRDPIVWMGAVIYSFCMASSYLFIVYTFVALFASFSMHCTAYRQYFQILINKTDTHITKKNYGHSAHQLFVAIRFRNLAKMLFF